MKIECPVYDYYCPYCIKGNCYMVEFDGVDPHKECEAFFEEVFDEDVEGDYEMGFDPYLGCYTDDC